VSKSVQVVGVTFTPVLASRYSQDAVLVYFPSVTHWSRAVVSN
jgi:hypothetical protein